MKKEVLVEISARHVHVSEEHLEILFGKGYKLTPKKDLSQPGQFACEERVTVVGTKKDLAGVSLLGPCRKATQVELSLTDDSGACKLVGPAGEVELTEGVIAAKRHIHMTTADAEKYGITDSQIVSVKIPTEGRALIFGDVVARVSDSYALAMHLDTDEANAAAIPGSCIGEILD